MRRILKCRRGPFCEKTKKKARKLDYYFCFNTNPSLLVVTVGAEDVSSFGHKSFVGQTEGAPLAVEAVFVPRAALKVHNIHTFTKTWKKRREEQS